MVKISIYRPNQIGGQITKISTVNTSILIDLGHNLPKEGENDAFDNSYVIQEITAGCSAVFYTHYHGDHIGLFHHVPSSIPQYIGEVAKQVVCRKYEQLTHLPDEVNKDRQDFRRTLEIAKRIKTFKANQKIGVGDIWITPYFVSHSAYDAYMFLIEVEGKRILHTGDYRGHGYLSKGLLPTIKKFVGQVDVLITEGTMLSRQQETILTEKALSVSAAKLMKKYKYVFVHCSSTDMERLASFKNANNLIRPHRPLISDSFQKDILEIFSHTAGEKSECFTFGKVYSYSAGNSRLRDWMVHNGFTMFVRSTPKFHAFLDSILPMIEPAETLFIYSQWIGYINDGNTQNMEYVKLQSRFNDSNFSGNIVRLHTSGHATVETLREVCLSCAPQMAIIPIHRENHTDLKSIGIGAELCEKVVTTDCLIGDIDISFM